MYKDLTGKLFGRLTAIKRETIEYKDGSKRGAWLCECECGNQKIIAARSLLKGKTKSCGCLQRESVFKGYMDISGQQWARIKHQAKARGIEISITLKEAWDLYERQGGKCAVSGVDISFSRDYSKDTLSNTCSLDRIDSSKPYCIENVQWVHKVTNIMKNKMSQDEFVRWCKLVAKYN